jgi:glyoxylase-like metal-dependent hydrolase (beta-lactamase superfamily II)
MPRIAEGLHRLGSDLINFYLVEDATGLTVVDAGVPAFYDKLEACLGEFGRRWEEIRALVLTHAHFDHVGFAERRAASTACPSTSTPPTPSAHAAATSRRRRWGRCASARRWASSPTRCARRAGAPST